MTVYEQAAKRAGIPTRVLVRQDEIQQTGVSTRVLVLPDETLPGQVRARPYTVETEIAGVCPMLFNRYDRAEAGRKAGAAENSRSIEGYVYRSPDGTIGVPAVAIKGALVQAARYESDPRSNWVSAPDLIREGLCVTPEITSLGKETWDYLDYRPVRVQRLRMPCAGRRDSGRFHGQLAVQSVARLGAGRRQ